MFLSFLGWPNLLPQKLWGSGFSPTFPPQPSGTLWMGGVFFFCSKGSGTGVCPVLPKIGLFLPHPFSPSCLFLVTRVWFVLLGRNHVGPFYFFFWLVLSLFGFGVLFVRNILFFPHSSPFFFFFFLEILNFHIIFLITLETSPPGQTSPPLSNLPPNRA